MRRLRVEFRPSAILDIETIFEYIFDVNKSAVVAGRFVQRIRDRCERIGKVPLGGRPRDDLELDLRTVPFEKTAVISYKVVDDCVWITNIFYGGRDYDTLYRGMSVDPDGPPIDIPPPICSTPAK